MASGLMTIVKKEVREMVRDPRLLMGMIIVPLIMFPMMGLAMSSTMESVEESTSHIHIGILDRDGDFRAAELTDYLTKQNISVTPLTEDVADQIIAGDYEEPSIILIIPQNFTVLVNNTDSVTVSLITRMDTYSLSESVPSDTVAHYIDQYRQLVLNERISEAFPNDTAWVVQYPVLVDSASVVDGEIVETTPGQITEQLMNQSLMMPMILMILIILAAQLAATSVAMEKEEKTLETLLTTPVPRSSILFGKIAGVVAVSALAVLAYIFGFSFYMAGVMSMQPQGVGLSLADMGLVPSMTGIVLMLVTLFLSLISALSLAVLVASFTEDVRSAQSLMGILYVPIFIPALVLMFADISQLPGGIQAPLLAIPFSYPVIASKALYTGQYFYVIVGIIYQAIFTAVVIYIAARFFSSEKIMTARFNLKQKSGSSPFPILNAIAGRKKRK